MATKRIWTGSGLLLFIFFIRAHASGNNSLSLDAFINSTTSVTTESAHTDGMETIQPNVTALPLNVQQDNNQTAGVAINATANSMNSSNYQNNTRLETTLAPTTGRSTTARLTTRSTTTTRNENHVKIEWDDRWDEPFKHDYTSLRQAGLTIAAVLFLMGIMLITCGKIRCSRRCQLTKGRSYEVTRM